MIENIAFDCDSTLTRIEGVDVLADMNDVWNEVVPITRSAMDKSSLSPDIYEMRLELIKPTLEQVKEVGDLYIANVSEDAKQVVSAFKAAGKNVYMLTGGLQPAVFMLARYLGIEYTRIFSVPIYFDQLGEYLDFDKSTPMVHRKGKLKVIGNISRKYGAVGMVGDGMSDVEAAEAAAMFVGYGGVVKRKQVKQSVDTYIECASLSPLLPIFLTEPELDSLGQDGFGDLIERGEYLLEKEVVRKP